MRDLDSSRANLGHGSARMLRFSYNRIRDRTTTVNSTQIGLLVDEERLTACPGGSGDSRPSQFVTRPTNELSILGH